MVSKIVHILETKYMQKKSQKYYCEKCDYLCSRKFLWEQHCSTQKHLRQHLETPTSSLDNEKQKYADALTIVDGNFVCECGRGYKQRAGLWKHKKKCKYLKNISEHSEELIIPSQNVKLEKENSELKDLVHKLLDNDQKTKKQMKDQLEQQNKIIQDMIPKLGNNNNNRFNVNVFLNENCRDAINMNDFIESLQVKLADLQYTKNNGLIEGISSVLVDGLKQLDMCKRPIHCTDVKREVLYIKNNDEWARENSTDHIRDAIGDVANKQRKAIAEWEKDNPDWKSTEKGKEEYITLVQSVMTEIAPQTENRIIRNIAKETVIQKQPNKE